MRTARLGRTLVWLAVVVAFAMPADCGAAGATAYRCDDAGRVTYTNLPCPAGRQTEIVATTAPSAADRSAADDRGRAERARLTAIERRRDVERQQDQRAAARAARRGVDRNREKNACPKLALRARRAHEDFETAGPRNQPAKRVAARRADEDFAALCRKR